MMVTGCTNTSTNPEIEKIPAPIKTDQSKGRLSLDSMTYYDKVLGALVGSAIGDAMGAGTEMWDRKSIQQEHGYIKGLTLVLREKSPEGIWHHQMDTGATTDDTRWKFFMVQYFKKNNHNLSLDHFAQFIIDHYQAEALGLSDPAILEQTDLLDEKMQRINWIKEWARVAIAYQKGGMEYEQVRNRFYGGEMSCAGMLYTPMFGLIFTDPETAYSKGFEHGMFDIGYARDIAGIVAAMTQIAMQTDSMDNVLTSSMLVDPYEYMNSRLIGRIPLAIAEDSKNILKAALELPLTDTVDLKMPLKYPGTKVEWLRQAYIYNELEDRQKAIAFHAGEIWQILYTSLAYGNGDFEKTMQFIVNYGRDNDTVAAVAGMILGAQLGYDDLPKAWKEKVVEISKDVMKIDLEELSSQVVDIQ